MNDSLTDVLHVEKVDPYAECRGPVPFGSRSPKRAKASHKFDSNGHRQRGERKETAGSGRPQVRAERDDREGWETEGKDSEHRVHQTVGSLLQNQK